MVSYEGLLHLASGESTNRNLINGPDIVREGRNETQTHWIAEGRGATIGSFGIMILIYARYK